MQLSSLNVDTVKIPTTQRSLLDCAQNYLLFLCNLNLKLQVENARLLPTLDLPDFILLSLSFPLKWLSKSIVIRSRVKTINALSLRKT